MLKSESVQFEFKSLLEINIRSKIDDILLESNNISITFDGKKLQWQGEKKQKYIDHVSDDY